MINFVWAGAVSIKCVRICETQFGKLFIGNFFDQFAPKSTGEPSSDGNLSVSGLFTVSLFIVLHLELELRFFSWLIHVEFRVFVLLHSVA